VTNVRERTLSILRDLSLRSRRRRGSIGSTGMYCWARSCIVTKIKETKNIRICRVWQESLLKVKWRR